MCVWRGGGGGGGEGGGGEEGVARFSAPLFNDGDVYDFLFAILHTKLM